MSRYSLWLRSYNEKRNIILEKLRKYKEKVSEIKKMLSTEKFILPVFEYKGDINSLKMCFVDGGQGIDELLGCVTYYIRASGLFLHQKKKFFLRASDFGILEYEDNTNDRIELLRSIMEIEIAEKCIQEYSPGYVFLDGSLHVNFSKREIPCEEYKIFRKKFFRLLKNAYENGVHLCGISEDSRSRLLVNNLESRYGIKFPSFMTDSSMLKFFTGSERFVTKEFTPEPKFNFENSNGIKPVNFPTVYLQPNAFSNPLRIDVPSWEKNLPEIISIIVKLSKGSKWYGYPYPLYLAHLDAKIENKQAEWNTLQIAHYVLRNDPEIYDAILKEKRRKLRPRG
ncbi:MAG: DNA double-strand break repair nuclease NurA [Candidatus Altiarchaeota archaeon]